MNCKLYLSLWVRCVSFVHRVVPSYLCQLLCKWYRCSESYNRTSPPLLLRHHEKRSCQATIDTCKLHIWNSSCGKIVPPQIVARPRRPCGCKSDKARLLLAIGREREQGGTNSYEMIKKFMFKLIFVDTIWFNYLQLSSIFINTISSNAIISKIQDYAP